MPSIFFGGPEGSKFPQSSVIAVASAHGTQKTNLSMYPSKSEARSSSDLHMDKRGSVVSKILFCRISTG